MSKEITDLNKMILALKALNLGCELDANGLKICVDEDMKGYYVSKNQNDEKVYIFMDGGITLSWLKKIVDNLDEKDLLELTSVVVMNYDKTK